MLCYVVDSAYFALCKKMLQKKPARSRFSGLIYESSTLALMVVILSVAMAQFVLQVATVPKKCFLFMVTQVSEVIGSIAVNLSGN